MVANTEPIFIRSVVLKTLRLQTGVIVSPTVAVGLTGTGQTLFDTQNSDHGGLIADLWCQPIGAIGAGAFLRFFFSDYDAQTINLLAEVAITTSSGSPFVRQELGNLLPELLTPTQTGIAGKKRGLYLPPNSQLAVGLSADLANPLVVGFQGGLY